MQGDGLCILHAFVEGISHLLDVYKSIPDVQEVLKNQLEKNKEHYSHFSADTKDIMVEFETIMKDPLKFYGSDTTDLKVNEILFQSDDAKCWVVTLSNEENPFAETLYFARSLSLRIDPVIPSEKLQRISNVSKIYFLKIIKLSNSCHIEVALNLNSFSSIINLSLVVKHEVFRGCNFPVD